MTKFKNAKDNQVMMFALIAWGNLRQQQEGGPQLQARAATARQRGQSKLFSLLLLHAAVKYIKTSGRVCISQGRFC